MRSQPGPSQQESIGSWMMPDVSGTGTSELRRGTRFSILQRCLVHTPSLAATEAAPAPEGWHCIAYNISATGIGIALPLCLRKGTALSIRAWGLRGVDVLTVRVVHAKAVDFLWFTGCELSKRLSHAELERWKSGSANWLDEQN